jgi:hypothetical protein
MINAQPEFLSARAARSTRGVGDELQSIVSEHLESILTGQIGDYVGHFERRAMADIAFSDSDGFYYAVDVKTHRLDTKFNMPNLTSVRRIAEFYAEDSNVFVTLIIKYGLDTTKVRVSQVHFLPIEFISWRCLRIGALGLGQIQIRNANAIELVPGYARRDWMLELCDQVAAYHHSESVKIDRQRQFFERIHLSWLEKQ